MLAPKVAIKAATVNAAHAGADVKITKDPMHLDVQQVHTHPTQERLDKVFEKLDLTGAQGWSDKERQEVKNLFNRIS